MPERAELPPSVAEDMPHPSPELTMIGALMRAHMASLPPRKRRVFLANLMEVFEEYEGTSNVVRLRSKALDPEVTKARRGAVAWTRAMMAAFFMLDVEKPLR
jgi:hypothetical protein